MPHILLFSDKLSILKSTKSNGTETNGYFENQNIVVTGFSVLSY